MLICPVCKEKLICKDRRYFCKNNHSFDVSSKNYVNLLLNNSSGKHGDDKLMVRARRGFLEKDFYLPLAESVVKCASAFENQGTVIDCGCGECYYTAKIADEYPTLKMYGCDISKFALAEASKRRKNIELTVASAGNLPFSDGSADGIINIFSPLFEKEFLRVLKKGGILLRVIPLEDHLFELKSCIYEKPYKNPAEDREICGFELINETKTEYTVELNSNEDIVNLFKMTPYYYKTGARDQQKIEKISSLKTLAQFGVLVYKKN